MYKLSIPAQKPPLIPESRPPDELRRRALDLVMLEIQHQPMLKLRSFASGFLVGVVMMAALEYGYHQGIDRAALVLEGSARHLPPPPDPPQ